VVSFCGALLLKFSTWLGTPEAFPAAGNNIRAHSTTWSSVSVIVSPQARLPLASRQADEFLYNPLTADSIHAFPELKQLYHRPVLGQGSPKASTKTSGTNVVSVPGPSRRKIAMQVLCRRLSVIGVWLLSCRSLIPQYFLRFFCKFMPRRLSGCTLPALEQKQ
jgi:hypothetical protein